MGSAQKRQHFAVIEELRDRHLLQLLLHHAGVSKAGYYKWKKSQHGNRLNNNLEQHILAIHSIRPYYGYRRVAVSLRR